MASKPEITMAIVPKDWKGDDWSKTHDFESTDWSAIRIFVARGYEHDADASRRFLSQLGFIEPKFLKANNITFDLSGKFSKWWNDTTVDSRIELQVEYTNSNTIVDLEPKQRKVKVIKAIKNRTY